MSDKNMISGLGIWLIGESDWFIAESEALAVKAFCELIGEKDAMEIIIDYPPVQLTSSDLDKHLYFYDFENRQGETTFRKRMIDIIEKNEPVNCFFASREV